jgi:hypothetical protein
MFSMPRVNVWLFGTWDVPRGSTYMYVQRFWQRAPYQNRRPLFGPQMRKPVLEV